jgi:hypothetical protein
MSINYLDKYLKYKTKYLKVKQQIGGNMFLTNPVTILHDFNTNFKDITKNLDKYKEMGITHIQPSPIQLCRTKIGSVLLMKKKMTSEPSKPLWWLAYQPNNYNIGNYYGTKEEVMELIKQANQKEINIIVDVVINHICAIEDYEYALWDLILNMYSEYMNKLDVDYTFWDLYQLTKTNKIKVEDYLEDIKSDPVKLKIINSLINQYSNEIGKKDKLILFDTYIDDLINIKLKMQICKYLEIDEKDFKEEYYDIINLPFWCSDSTPYGHNCWLAQALPQLNQKNKIVRHKIMQFLRELKEMGVKGLRIDAASHIEPKILKFYIDYFKYLHNNDKKIYIYSEVINPQGTHNHHKLHDFVKISHITEYNLLNKFNSIFCMSCDLHPLNVLSLPSGDIGSVVFSTTHDLEKIKDGDLDLDPALNMGDYSKMLNSDTENYKKNLILCYLLQRISNVPLVFKTQLDDKNVVDCIKFRKFLNDNKCIKEHSEINNNIIFKSDKFDTNNKKIATFYLNVSGENKLIDFNDIPKKGIFIKYY